MNYRNQITILQMACILSISLCATMGVICRYYNNSIQQVVGKCVTIQTMCRGTYPSPVDELLLGYQSIMCDHINDRNKFRNAFKLSKLNRMYTKLDMVMYTHRNE